MAYPKAARWCLTALGLCLATGLIAGGLYICLHFCTLPVFEYNSTLSWKSTKGTVVTLEEKHMHFDCYVTYNYTVEGTHFLGNHTRTIGHHNHFEDHGHHALCFRLNHTRSKNAIDVWYDPKAPAYSALKVSFVGDFWLAMHGFDSLALVALGGAVIFWATHVEAAIFALAGSHAALVAVSCVPVSAVRVSRREITAVGPLVFGLICAILSAACLFQLGWCHRSGDGINRDKAVESWWTDDARDDAQNNSALMKAAPQHFFVVDDEPEEGDQRRQLAAAEQV